MEAGHDGVALRVDWLTDYLRCGSAAAQYSAAAACCKYRIFSSSFYYILLSTLSVPLLAGWHIILVRAVLLPLTVLPMMSFRSFLFSAFIYFFYFSRIFLRLLLSYHCSFSGFLCHCFIITLVPFVLACIVPVCLSWAWFGSVVPCFVAHITTPADRMDGWTHKCSIGWDRCACRCLLHRHFDLDLLASFVFFRDTSRWSCYCSQLPIGLLLCWWCSAAVVASPLQH